VPGRARASRGRGGGVVELLLGAEEQVEELVAHVGGDGHRHAGADHQDQQLAAEATAALALAALADGASASA
jgi:hypothetical protein